MTRDPKNNNTPQMEIHSKTDLQKTAATELPKVAAPKTRHSLYLRHWVQIILFAVIIGVGIQFAIFVHQAQSMGPVSVQRPPGVEGFLPIGALMGWKLFFSTGIWDPIHPAAMVILGFSAIVCLALRKSFCSWICPVGTLSEWMWRLGRLVMGRNFQPPYWIDILLRSAKYALLGFFVWVIFQMDARAIIEFLQSPYYKMSDVKMLHFFTRMTALTGGVLLFLTVGSFFLRNFWCRYLCPYGALMGLFAMVGPTHIQRCTDSCIDCGRCTKACPYHLPVEHKQAIRGPECTGCLDCIESCPVKGTLSLKTMGSRQKSWSAAWLGITIVLLLALSIYTARITGHWQGRVHTREFQILLQQIDAPQMTHPSVGNK